MKRWLLAGATLPLALSACEPAAPPRDGLPAVSRAQAADLFAEHCVICHGERGDGRGPRRGSLHKKPPDFRQQAWRAGRTAAELRSVIRNGSPGTDMPAWRTLSDEEVAGLASYVLTLGTGDAADGLAPDARHGDGERR